MPIDYSKWDRVADGLSSSASSHASSDTDGDDDVRPAVPATSEVIAHEAPEGLAPGVTRLAQPSTVMIGPGGHTVAGGGSAARPAAAAAAHPRREPAAAASSTETVRVVLPTDPDHPHYAANQQRELEQRHAGTQQPQASFSAWTRNGAWAELRVGTAGATLPIAWSQSADAVTLRVVLGWTMTASKCCRVRDVRVDPGTASGMAETVATPRLRIHVDHTRPESHLDARNFSFLRRGGGETQPPAVADTTRIDVPLRHAVRHDEEAVSGAWSVSDVHVTSLTLEHGCPIVPVYDDDEDAGDAGDDDAPLGGDSCGAAGVARVLEIELGKFVSAPHGDLHNNSGSMGDAGGPVRIWWLTLGPEATSGSGAGLVEKPLDPATDLVDRKGDAVKQATRFGTAWEEAHRMFQERVSSSAKTVVD